jgi:uncharacterized protein (TIGR03083 family)
MTLTTAERTAARVPHLDRPTAMRLAATEYDRFLAQLRVLDSADWTAPTTCPGWDVRAMASHVLGMAEMAASLRQQVHLQRAAARAGGGIDALTGVQVRERIHLSPGDVMERLAVVAPRAVRGRRRMPALLRHRAMPEEQVVGGAREKWTFGFLVDVILTRDPWMHRLDIARAVGSDAELTADHDGVLVADVVAEWAQRHGSPYRLHLTGPAGGSWSAGDGGPELELDATEFCRLISGRGTGTGLLAEQVPF